MISDQQLPGGINADHRVYSNYFSDNNVIQQVALVQPKNLLIDSLRKVFRADSIFTYRDDEYGFPLTPDLTGGDIDSEETTKILISDLYRYEVKFFPSIIIKSGGGSYSPLSFNQDATYKHRTDCIVDDYGEKKYFTTPTHRIYNGRWDMSFEIQIYSESHSELEELVDIVSMILQYSAWQELRENGLFIKSLNIGGENAEPYANDYVYSQAITISTLSEWRVEIPIESLVEKIVFRFEPTWHHIPGISNKSDVISLKYNDVIEMAEIE